MINDKTPILKNEADQSAANNSDTEPEKDFISEADLAVLGAREIVYLKPIAVDDLRTEVQQMGGMLADELSGDEQDLFAIHAADGTRIAIVQTHAAAVQAAHQYNMTPVSVH